MTAAIFPGEAMPLPVYADGVFSSEDELPGPVRFARGFDDFAEFVREHGLDPQMLGDDFPALWQFLGDHADTIGSGSLAESAAIFLGNAIAILYPAARWEPAPEPEIGTDTMRVPVRDFLRAVMGRPDGCAEFLAELEPWASRDRQFAEVQALRALVQAPVFRTPAVPLVAPPIADAVYRDETGAEIAYGSRWEGAGPPEDAYSRVTHPERFAPMSPAVDAMVEYLSTWYDVDVAHEDTAEGRRITLTPAAGAPMVIDVVEHIVSVRAGAAFYDINPVCTCDACDEIAEYAVEELARVLTGIAAGGLREFYPAGHQQRVLQHLFRIDGSAGSTDHGLEHLSDDERATAVATLESLTDGWWPAWPLREGV